ncbi:unnamed protein product, partial [Hymenolepis diminuta]
MLSWIVLLFAQYSLGMTLAEAKKDPSKYDFYSADSFREYKHAIFAILATYGYLTLFIQIVNFINKRY